MSGPGIARTIIGLGLVPADLDRVHAGAAAEIGDWGEVRSWPTIGLPAKIRAAITCKIRLVVVIGRREVEQRAVTVRYRSGREIPCN